MKSSIITFLNLTQGFRRRYAWAFVALLLSIVLLQIAVVISKVTIDRVRNGSAGGRSDGD